MPRDDVLRVSAFIVDQQLPSRLAAHLSNYGHDARHVKQYPGGTTLRDTEIAAIADRENRIVVTKDDHFRVLHLNRLSRFSRCPLSAGSPGRRSATRRR